ncbi:hypothetical protein CONPUDRAFT_140085 [Coniophora puteana RWD-64-598 SS2]|uniref:Uncharacterized protein n=1 Tax=Coniophora puteana (strain RWD-64-598) TaxID=741705 RepID=A0A5M3MAT7_CONPW|nr:uncharacterized protein CONPUDRAFT_140085 [Coniophora puteana RWD-64-598 SS2]EIW75751.1 hypothetical protein CONPUDRAFT_140085 [Coniophora puteana RWD-64-598 SS2]
MTDIQTAEEKELIAKWNAGDYTAEGWVNNTDGLTEEALNGLAEYNTNKYFNSDNLDEESLLKVSDVDTLALFESFAATAASNAAMSVTTGRVNNVPAVIAEVFNRFAPGFGRFRAVFERQGSAGNARINGQVRWETGGAVSTALGLAVLQNDLPAKPQVVLSATTSGVPPSPRLQFTGPSGNLTFKTTFRGSGRYMA